MIRIKRSLIILGLLILALPVIVYFPNKGTNDMGIWLEWTAHINRWGPLNAYSIVNTNHDYQSTDYPPISFINLWAALKTATLGNVSSMIGIKTVILAYYLATWVTLVYLSTLITGRSFMKGAAISSGLFLGGLYFVISSVALSYLDITFAPFIVISLFLFSRQKYLFSGVTFLSAILVKWIPMIILPVFLFYFISKVGRRYRIDHSPMIKFFTGITLTVCLMVAVFWLNHISLFFLIEALSRTFIRPSSSLSDGALNFNWIVNYFMQLIYPNNYIEVIRNNFHNFQLVSALIFSLVGIAVLNSFLKKKKDMGSLLQTSLMLSWSYFIWRTGVHENHLFTTVLIALCLTILYTNKSNIRQYLWLCFIGLANYVVFFGFPIRGGSIFISDSFMTILGINLTVLISALHVLIYLVYLRNFLQFQRRRETE